MNNSYALKILLSHIFEAVTYILHASLQKRKTMNCL